MFGGAPWRVGAKYRKITPRRPLSHQLWTIWCKNQIDITYQFSEVPPFWSSHSSSQVWEFSKNSPSPTPWRKSLKFGTLVGVGIPQGKKLGAPGPILGELRGQSFNFPTPHQNWVDRFPKNFVWGPTHAPHKPWKFRENLWREFRDMGQSICSVKAGI